MSNISPSPELRNEFADELRVLGIDCKGFGVMPKAVMLDPDLTAQAKAIYAYFASFTGAGTTAFPSRDRIVYDLNINKETFYRHFKLLTDNGYITVDQPHGGAEEGNTRFGRNIYTLVQNPAKYAAPAENGPAVLRASGLKAFGYGTIPKTVMIDRRLDLKAKALYAYLSAYAGAGRVACPSRQDATFHLSLSNNTFSKCLLALREYNYITVVQRRTESGQVGCNDYVLNDNPNLSEAVTKHTFAGETSKASSEPCLKFPDTGNITPCLKKPYTGKPYTEEPYTKNADTNNNRIDKQQSKNEQFEKNIKINVVENSIHPSYLPSSKDGRKDNSSIAQKEESKKLVINDPAAIREIIRNEGKISYSLLDDDTTRTAMIHLIAEWDVMCDKNNYAADRSYDFEAYRLAAETLNGMLHPAFSRKIDGRYINFQSVLERVNRYIEPVYCSLSDYIRTAAQNFIDASKAVKIKQPVRYMETCIWTVLQEGNIRAEADFAESGFGDVYLSHSEAESKENRREQKENFSTAGGSTDWDALARERQAEWFAKLDDLDRNS